MGDEQRYYKFLLDHATRFGDTPTDEDLDKIVEAVHWLDATQSPSGVVRDPSGQTARSFWLRYQEEGLSDYHLSCGDGEQRRLRLSVWDSADGSPTLRVLVGSNPPFPEGWSED